MNMFPPLQLATKLNHHENTQCLHVHTRTYICWRPSQINTMTPAVHRAPAKGENSVSTRQEGNHHEEDAASPEDNTCGGHIEQRRVGLGAKLETLQNPKLSNPRPALSAVSCVVHSTLKGSTVHLANLDSPREGNKNRKNVAYMALRKQRIPGEDNTNTYRIGPPPNKSMNSYHVLLQIEKHKLADT